jgi:hypothetical protein
VDKFRVGVSSHFLNSLFYIGSGKIAAQWPEKEHDFGTRRAKSSNFPRQNVEISVIHDWRDKRDGSAGQCKVIHKQRSY